VQECSKHHLLVARLFIVLRNPETVGEIYLCLYLVQQFNMSLKTHCVRHSTHRVEFNRLVDCC